MFRLTFEPSSETDVVISKKNFSYKLIHFSESFPINGNYNIKTNSNNNLKGIKIIKK